jgi:sugar phosphate isomerase/epimerase
MKLSQLAAQLYTVRDHCQTAADLAATAKKIRAIGYPAVQLSGLGPISEKEIVTIMRDAGLGICATHEPSQEILDQPELSIARLQRLGCTLTAYPFPRDVDFTKSEQVRTLVRKLDAAGEKFRAAGMVLGYHNHAIEFVKFEGAPVLDFIYANTGPLNLVGEIDTYWIHYGGGDVVEWCEKLRDRLPFIHLKDYGFTAENKPTYCEIGNGTLNWKKIIRAAEASGCRWFIVEQDTCPGDPFDSLKLSFDYIRANLVSG